MINLPLHLKLFNLVRHYIKTTDSGTAGKYILEIGQPLNEITIRNCIQRLWEMSLLKNQAKGINVYYEIPTLIIMYILRNTTACDARQLGYVQYRFANPCWFIISLSIRPIFYI